MLHEQELRDWGMQLDWGYIEKSEFGKFLEKGKLEGREEEAGIMLSWILGKLVARMWNKWNWFKIIFSGGL
jgi:hypothetical protein